MCQNCGTEGSEAGFWDAGTVNHTIVPDRGSLSMPISPPCASRSGAFGPFIAVYLMFYVFQNVPVPLFPLAFVRALGLTDGTISLGNALFYGAMFLASTQLGRLSGLLVHRRVLILGALFYGLYPLLIALAQTATLFWVASFLGGCAWGLAGAGLINRLMERVQPDDLPAHMALHNLALNLGMLGGSLIGPALANAFGLREALLMGGGLRYSSSKSATKCLNNSGARTIFRPRSESQRSFTRTHTSIT